MQTLYVSVPYTDECGEPYGDDDIIVVTMEDDVSFEAVYSEIWNTHLAVHLEEHEDESEIAILIMEKVAEKFPIKYEWLVRGLTLWETVHKEVST